MFPCKLSKFLALSGIGARRKVCAIIEARTVTINGELVLDPSTVVEKDDAVEVAGVLVKPETKQYILLNKPRGYLSSVSDDQGRSTVLDLIKVPGKQRLYPVGRLDMNSTGLLLLTNDGELAHRLAHPKFGVKKRYRVKLSRPLSPTDEVRMRGGIRLEDGLFKADRIKVLDPNRKIVEIEIHDGRNRILKRVFEKVGIFIKGLDRDAYAGLSKKGLGVGASRPLTTREIHKLRKLSDLPS